MEWWLNPRIAEDPATVALGEVTQKPPNSLHDEGTAVATHDTRVRQESGIHLAWEGRHNLREGREWGNERQELACACGSNLLSNLTRPPVAMPFSPSFILASLWRGRMGARLCLARLTGRVYRTRDPAVIFGISFSCRGCALKARVAFIHACLDPRVCLVLRVHGTVLWKQKYQVVQMSANSQQSNSPAKRCKWYIVEHRN